MNEFIDPIWHLLTVLYGAVFHPHEWTVGSSFLAIFVGSILAAGVAILIRSVVSTFTTNPELERDIEINRLTKECIDLERERRPRELRAKIAALREENRNRTS